jgi:putative flippase GtrA
MVLKFLNRERSNNIYIQLFRYFFAGGIAFIVDASILYTLTHYFNVYYLVSSVISYSVGLLITYFFSIYWIFDERRTKNRNIEFGFFTIIGISGLLLTTFFMWFFTNKLGLFYMFSKICTTILVFGWNFILKKKFLFTKRHK